MDASRLLLDASGEILILVDTRTMTIREANHTAVRLLGYTREALLGMHVIDIECALSDLFFWDEVLGQQGSGETEGAYRCADGSILRVLKVALPVGEGKNLYVVRSNPVEQRKRLEDEILEMSSRLSATLEATGDGILLIDSENAILNMNFRFSQMWALPKILLDSRDDGGIFDYLAGQIKPGQSGILISALHNLDADDNSFDTLQLHDGRVFELRSLPVRTGQRIIGRVHYYRDVTEQKKVEEKLRIAAFAFESQEGMLVTDAKMQILQANRAFSQITGYTGAEILGKTPNILSSGRHDAQFYQHMWTAINSDGAWEGEIWNKRKSGEIYPELLTITAIKNQDGVVSNYVATFRDITKSKAAEEEIKYLGLYDALTGLPNRRLLADRLQQALAASSRSGHEGALLFIDLDNFKTLNDTLGHDIGDILLQQVAQRLSSCVREGDSVARMGGDEFVVMLEELSHDPLDAAAQTEAVGHKILNTLSQPYQLSKYQYHSTPSIGATLFNDKHDAIDELFKQADIAMYQAKQAGRNALRFFDPKMQEVINNRAVLEGELHRALDNQQFQLYYQIQVDSMLCPVGAEALIRWIHPERGLVSPAQFIPLSEETGHILAIGQWVLETACAQLKAWESSPLTNTLTLSLNVSAKQFLQRNFVEQVHDTIERFEINPKLLKLEPTESLLMDDIEGVIITMNSLKEIGVQFALDDFGTGYSSLQYLKRLPLDQLKIDQSFVFNLATDSSDLAIVRTIIAMAHSLNLGVIAEGVETEQQRQLLLDIGCTHFQGYLFSKPVPVGQFEELLKL
ncbi:MAG: EAL domain-containing protein [Gallionellaceae bacterium]|jgi:diguanylate cyclase (GGDEF)-like protein/PAS domain S-box-containing protein